MKTDQQRILTSMYSFISSTYVYWRRNCYSHYDMYYDAIHFYNIQIGPIFSQKSWLWTSLVVKRIYFVEFDYWKGSEIENLIHTFLEDSFILSRRLDIPMHSLRTCVFTCTASKLRCINCNLPLFNMYTNCHKKVSYHTRDDATLRWHVYLGRKETRKQ